MVNFPTSLDDAVSLPNPGSTDKTNSPNHSALHTTENAAIIALEDKLGTGSSTPVSNRLLLGTGTGTSAWSALTSAALAGILSDETGTGLVVFNNTPTLITPKVDVINENTSANGVTIDSLNIKDGKLNTNNSVVTANITDSAVTTAKIADDTITAGKIDTSTYPRFSATKTSSQDLGVNDTYVATTFTNELFDVGSGYNATTGVFTAPVAGDYQFSASVIANSAGQTAGIGIVFFVNGTDLYAQQADYDNNVSADRMSVRSSMFLRLAVSDTVVVQSKLVVTGGVANIDAGSTFNGVMLFQS